MSESDAKKKSKKSKKKMGLAEFLADSSLGGGGSSWADEMDSVIPSAPKAAFSDDQGGERRGGFGDRGYDRDRGDRFQRDDVQHPVPDAPPFVLFIGNLPFDLDDDDVTAFFDGCNLVSIRVIRDMGDKPKGFGYVEFADRESLVKGLDRNGESIRNRAVRVNVAEPSSRGSREDRTTGEWRRAEPVTPTGPEPSSARRSGFNFRDRQGEPDRTEGASTWRRADPLPAIDTSRDGGMDGPRSARMAGGGRWGFAGRDESGGSTPVRDTAPDVANWRDRPAGEAPPDERRSGRFGGFSSRNESPVGRDGMQRSYSGGLRGTPRDGPRGRGVDTEWKGGAFQSRPERFQADGSERRVSAPAAHVGDTDWKGGAFSPRFASHRERREGEDDDEAPRSATHRSHDTDWKGGAFKSRRESQQADEDGSGKEGAAPAQTEEKRRQPPPPSKAELADTWRRSGPLPEPEPEEKKDDDYSRRRVEPRAPRADAPSSRLRDDWRRPEQRKPEEDVKPVQTKVNGRPAPTSVVAAAAAEPPKNKFALLADEDEDEDEGEDEDEDENAFEVECP